jgi:predicted CopG family antitoxin
MKTLKIEADAYDRLDQARRSGETISEVIRRCVPKKRSAEEILEIFRKSAVSEESLQAIDESVSRRRRAPRPRRD